MAEPGATSQASSPAASRAPARPALPSPDPASPHLSLTGAGAVPGSQGQHHTSPSHTWQIPCAGLRSRERSVVAQLNWGPRKRSGGGPIHSLLPRETAAQGEVLRETEAGSTGGQRRNR